MRILMTTDTVGGVWTFTSELTQQLIHCGHSVHLVSFGRRPSPDQEACASRRQTSSVPPIARHLDRSRTASPSCGAERPLCSADSAETAPRNPATFTYTPTEIPLEWTQNNEQAFEQGQSLLLAELQDHPADLIVSNQFCFGRLATTIPRVVIAHSDVLSWARACKPSALEATPWLNRYTSMVQSGLLDAAAVVTPTAWMGKALTASFLLPRNCFVIPNGVSVGPAPDPPPSRKFQGITAGRLWDEAKGLDTLKDLDVAAPLLVAGENVFESPDPNASWPGNLVSLGPLSPAELHAVFRESSFYLCASRYEPFGLAPLEAALCGCAVLCRDIPSLREVWGDAALYFNDNVSLAKLIQQLGFDYQLLSAAQTRAHQRALQYTPQRMADSYLHLFHSILQSQATQHVA